MLKKRKILDQISSRTGQVAVLVDPEKSSDHAQMEELVRKAEFAGIDYFFIGGSTVTREEFTNTVDCLQALSSIPLVIFPGAAHQISDKADAILYLSLISGRNPDYLIGHHVLSASELFDMDIEIIPTAYMLIDGGKQSSVAYVSQTSPIPSDKESIILNTAKAGILQGKKLVYLDAGSGAIEHVPGRVVQSIKRLGEPVIVGGGIRSMDHLQSLANAGANVIVVGNKVEEHIDFLLDIHHYIQQRG